MPDVNRMTIDHAVEASKRAFDLGISTIALFPYVDSAKKTSLCEEAWNPDISGKQGNKKNKERIAGNVGDARCRAGPLQHRRT